MWLPFDPLGVRRFANAKRLVRSVVSREVESHRRSLDPHNPRDYIDAFLVEAAVDEATSSSSSTQTLRSTFTCACLFHANRVANRGHALIQIALVQVNYHLVFIRLLVAPVDLYCDCL